jgi:transglutaminase-like putative cysteine protease
MENPQSIRPPITAAIASLLAFVALALSCGAYVSLALLSAGLLASYFFSARYENQGLTKWTLRIAVIGSLIFSYWVSATKDDNAFLDMRYGYSFALAAAGEIVLQFWRREPTGGARAPLTVMLSALVFLAGCSTLDDTSHYLWYLAPAYFLFLTLAMPRFRGSTIPLRLTVVPTLIALLVGGVGHAGFYIYKNDLNAFGSKLLSGQHATASIGMSGRPMLGSSFTLRDSLTRVLRVHNIGDDPYLRGMVFDSYSERAWGLGLDQRTFMPYRESSLVPKGVEKSAIAVDRLDDANGLIFAPLHSRGVHAATGHFLEWAPQTDGPMRTPPTDTDPLSYTIAPGKGDRPHGLIDAAPSSDERARDLVVSRDIDGRVVEKAKEIGSGLTTDEQKIGAVILFLHSNNQYSLTTDPGRGDPISNFILEHKNAHCEYFASSAVVLLRALNVPTRYVSGYYAHESEGNGATLVRQRDAHAWAEAWIDGSGWVAVDATPGNGRPDALAGAIPPWWRVWERIQDLLGVIRRWVTTSDWTQKAAVFSLLVLGLLIPQIYRYWQRRRQAKAEFRYSQPEQALTALAQRFERLLVRLGQPCPAGRTWNEHLRLTEEFIETRSSPLKAFVSDYSRFRFGPLPSSLEITQLDKALRSLEFSAKKETV